jgi:hypothetical protein
MADRRLLPIACLLLASICACTSSPPTRDQSPQSVWSAVGVPAIKDASQASRFPTAATTLANPRRRVPATSLRSTSYLRTEPTVAHRLEPASVAAAPPFPRPQSVDQESIDAVALDGARALASADTSVDPRPQHTAVRAAQAGWLTPAYAREQLHASLVAAPGAEWNVWTRHRAYLLVSSRLSGDDHPADTATVAARVVLLTEQPIGRDGWHGDPVTSVVAVVLMKVNHVWRIDSDQPG